MQGLQSMLQSCLRASCYHDALADWTLCALGIGVPISSTVHNSFPSPPLPPLPPSLISDADAESRKPFAAIAGLVGH